MSIENPCNEAAPAAGISHSWPRGKLSRCMIQLSNNPLNTYPKFNTTSTVIQRIVACGARPPLAARAALSNPSSAISAVYNGKSGWPRE
jgi:hypothetical protein